LVGITQRLLFFTNKAFPTVLEIGSCTEELVLEGGNFSSGLLGWRKSRCSGCYCSLGVDWGWIRVGRRSGWWMGMLGLHAGRKSIAD
jgi:hypothetical protein